MNQKPEDFRDKKYYGFAHKGSLDMSHPAMKLLLSLVNKGKNILDMGCGEGTRLNVLVENNKYKKAVGIDSSSLAIKLAKKNFPGLEFFNADLTDVPLKNETFDLLFSAYVFEHLTNPEKVLFEAKRVLDKGGKFLIVAPNFGSPNRRSPNSRESKLKKLFLGFFKDLKIFFKKDLSSLYWQSVRPKHDDYIIDADTTVEPYILTLIKFSKRLGFKTEFQSSYWEVDRFSLFQLPFRILGLFKVYPFNFWGPHLCIVLKK